MRLMRALGFIVGFGLCAAAAAQFPVFGPEFQVNTTTTGSQASPSIAVQPDDDFVIAWNSQSQDGDLTAVVGRRFDGEGGAIGGEFLVNSYTTGYQFNPRIASDATGDFAVVWTHFLNGETASYEIRGRRFDEGGTPLGGDMAINQYTAGRQERPDLAMSSTGSFVVVWASGPEFGSGQPGQDGSGFGVFARRYDVSGSPLGDEFQVNQYTTGQQSEASVAMRVSGDFIVVWRSAQETQEGGVFARLYEASGNPAGDEFQVNTFEAGSQYPWDVALDSAGRAIVAWSSDGQDGAGRGIYAQRLDAAGGKLGPELHVNTFTTGHQLTPRIAIGPDDDFAISWASSGQDDPTDPNSMGIFEQRFDSSGRRDGSEFPVNVYTTGQQSVSTIACDSRGQFITAWASYLQDGSSFGVEARRLGFPPGVPMKVDQRSASTAVPAASNVNGVLEVGENVAVDPGYRNSSTTSLSLIATASNLTGPEGPIYTLEDPSADYGTISAGATTDCFTASGDCYEVSVSGARPVPHWDATFDEALSLSGLSKTWTLHVGGSFPDVPQSAFYPFIENLFHNGVTGGCAGGGYCPASNVTRAQMAVFLLKARYGPGFLPPPATGIVFSDVPASNPFAPWIEELSRQGISGGCGGGLYCPTNTVTRQQMAVFLLKTKNGSSYAPPPGIGTFADVAPCPGTVCDFIEDLYNQEITGGCQTNPVLLYCPGNAVLRQQMAVFLVKTFGLQLYGP